MKYGVHVGRVVIGIIAVAVLLSVSSVSAARLTSPSYELDTNLGGTFSGATSSSSYKMQTVGGETVVGNGAGGSYKLSQQPPSTDSAVLELTAPEEPVELGQITSGQSKSFDFSLEVNSTASDYSLSIQQDHNLQTADAQAAIPAISASTGLGSGANFASFPNAATVFYTGTSGVDTITMRARLDVELQQRADNYSNQITFIGTMVP